MSFVVGVHGRARERLAWNQPNSRTEARMTTQTTPQQTTPQTTQQKLDERYGRTARSRRFWAVFGAIGVTAMVLVAGWFAIASSEGETDAATTGYTLVDAHSVTVTFQVTVLAGSALACVLEAQDADHAVVGWRVVEYPAADVSTQSFTETVPTVAAATTGLVDSCWVP